MSFHDLKDETSLQRQQLFNALIARLQEFVIVLTDSGGSFISWHPGVKQLFGYTEDEFIGRHSDILLPPSDRLRGVGRQELEEAARTGKASDTRALVTKTGQALMVEGVRIALRSESGELLGFGKVLRDVTQQQSAQEELAGLARALDQSVVIVRKWDGVIEHWTTGCHRMYGWSAEEAVGKQCQELLKTAFPIPQEDIQRQLIEDGTWNGELHQIRKDGGTVVTASYWALLSDDQKHPVSIIESHTDITSRIAARRELEAAHRKLQTMAVELERSNQELEEFARIASHDLSAPITSTRWIAEMLATRYSSQLDEGGRKCVAQITQGLDRMAQLVEAILAHARIGTTSISSAELSHCEDALGVAIDNLHSYIQDSGAQIYYETLPALEIRPQALTQLFQNLISNAIKYRRADVVPAIYIRAAWREPMWMISVSDNGIGIEQEWFDRIFRPMQRRHGLEVAGSGIGLATCKKIVNRTGGSIWVESEVGVGSTFYCTLPGPDPASQDKLHAAPAALDDSEDDTAP